MTHQRMRMVYIYVCVCVCMCVFAWCFVVCYYKMAQALEAEVIKMVGKKNVVRRAGSLEVYGNHKVLFTKWLRGLGF
jgi:hypothetical protein